MIEVEAAKILKEDSCWECSLGTLHGATQCGNTQCNVARATNLAVTALEQLALYKEGGLCLVPADIYEKQCKELDELKNRRWIPCSERLPDIGERVLLYVYGRVYIGKRINSKLFEEYDIFSFDNGVNESTRRIEAWRPLPALPEEG